MIAWVLFSIVCLCGLAAGLMARRMLEKARETIESLGAELAATKREVARLSTTDTLTGLLNRRAMEQALALQFVRFTRYDESAALLSIDIDHFRAINDRYGHAMGDKVIRSVADIMRDEIRTGDIAARWGGEEFVILLPHVDLAGAEVFAERLRAAVEGRIVHLDGQSTRCTVSVGLALTNQDMATLDDWLQRADDALDDAKDMGRNRVVSGHEDMQASLFDW